MDHQRHGAVSMSHIPSSSPSAPMPSPNGLLSPTRTTRRKEKRNPSVTPRRFGRFFNPRTYQLRGRCILGDLDSSSTNQQPISPQSLFSDPLTSDPFSPSSPTQRLSTGTEDESRKRKWSGKAEPIIKRRGVLPGDMPPPQLNLSRQSLSAFQDGDSIMQDSQNSLEVRRKATLSQFFRASRGGNRGRNGKSLCESPSIVSKASKPQFALEDYQPTPIRKFGNRGFEAQLLNREHGFSSHAGRQYLAFPACDPRIETAAFCSRSYDTYQCRELAGQKNTIPFSIASCHSAPVTAIGDEEGCVRFFNTTMTSDPSVSKVDSHFKVHDNAIMGVTFSEDDLRLATACGDRSAKIVDVNTQSVAVELNAGHCDSLRQITFQPGNSTGNVLATSDHSGRIQIWDLRCSSAPVQLFSSYGPNGFIGRNHDLAPLHARTVNTVDVAHERVFQGVASPASVTALQWMPSGQEHLLLSACEANAVIKLWDTRYIKPRRQFEEIPLATTLVPASHAWRNYGITSMTLSSDATRLYAVCKDHTIYAYSTEHLMLGHAPELLPGAAKRRPNGVEGLGPLYGFKHDSFRVRTFYVKSALRPSRNQHASDLLAVGSSDTCAVLFPTDERYLRAACAQREHILDSAAAAPTPSQSFSSASGAPTSSPIPIFRNGTSLIRGHSREVTTVSWSHEGRLVTASDDCLVRQWQEDEDKARYLRQVGEFGGERHMAGWADIDDDWDVDESEEV